MSFSENFKARRLEQKIRKREIAKITGINEATLCRYEKGEATPRGTNLAKIAEALQCTPGDLIPDFVVETKTT